MYRVARTVHGHRDGHILHFELINRLHAQISEGDYPCGANCLGNQICCPAHGNQGNRAMFADGFDARGTALCLADHPDQPGPFQHELRKLVHARGRGGACGPHHLPCHRIHRAHVINEAVRKIQPFRQGFPT